jgi:hypothetical protein
MEDINEKLGKKKKKDISDLKRLLKKGAVKFSYRKVSTGNTRVAVGTWKKSLIPEDLRDDDRMREPNDEVLTYYDIKKEDYRCFRLENFEEILEDDVLYKKDNK